jgi:ABC-type microcin C transport system permease subunit YejB
VQATEWREKLRVLFPAAFTIGYASHLLGDVYQFLLAGQYFKARFLLYPIYALPEASADQIAPWTRILDYYQHMQNQLEIGLILLAVVVFLGVRLWTARSKSRPKIPR